MLENVKLIIGLVVVAIVVIAIAIYDHRGSEVAQLKQTVATTQAQNQNLTQTVQTQSQANAISENTALAVATQSDNIVATQAQIVTDEKRQEAVVHAQFATQAPIPTNVAVQAPTSAPVTSKPALEAPTAEDQAISTVRINSLWASYCTATENADNQTCPNTPNQ